MKTLFIFGILAYNLIFIKTHWPQQILNEFGAWKQEFGIEEYPCSVSEDRAIRNFWINKQRILEHHKAYCAGNYSYTLGTWENSCCTVEQNNKLLNGLVPSEPEALMLQRSLLFSLGGYVIVSPTEENFDWTSIGAVNEVGNQKNCASCYAFAASDAIEAQIFLRTNELFELSNQQLVDCSKNYGNFGCNYGNTANTFKYIIDNGITIERNYKYKAKELKSCLYDSSTKVANISDYRQVRLPTDDFLRDILYSVGPLTVGIDSSLFSFQHYKFGIYKDENCSENINHAVLLVGFGVDETHGKYWIIKNSYGKNFGEKGFMRLTREIENFCGIRNYVVFPVNDISINYLIT